MLFEITIAFEGISKWEPLPSPPPKIHVDLNYENRILIFFTLTES